MIMPQFDMHQSVKDHPWLHTTTGGDPNALGRLKAGGALLSRALAAIEQVLCACNANSRGPHACS